ncbi:MAG: hypothetical protein LUG46_07625 [Erysipelotrichaceae bacterium]|nr:hypothetical protein [Erysipelotrichaceae bacterium]
MNRLLYRILSSKFGAYLEIKILMRQTAKVFGVKSPTVIGFSLSKLLKAYAQLTTDISMKFIENKQDRNQLYQNLYDMAYHLGSDLRWWLRPQNNQDCFSIIEMLYRHIGITLCEESSTICVYQCYFSDFYTPEVCSIISAIDQGIFAGVYQGGTLSFYKRITEGYEKCEAKFTLHNSSHKYNKEG